MPTIDGGGVEKNFFLISNYLSRKYKEIYVVTSNTDYKKSFHKNIKVICPKNKIWIKKNRFIKTLISAFLLIYNFFNKKVVILSFQSNIIAIWISKIFNFRIIIRLNTSVKKYIKGYFGKKFYKLNYKLSDKIIVNSLIFQKELKDYFNLSSNLIYNSYKPSLKKKRLIFFKNFNGLKIINIGRLTDQKDQITLLKSLNLLSKYEINFRCCVIGGGIKKKTLNNYINEKKLNNFVKLIGYKDNAENYLDSSNLFILTSRYEGLPNVLIEAQSRNLPIISSDCPTGPSEILLKGKLGDLFKVGDHKKLSYLITNFVEDKKKLLNKSKKAKKFLKRFELEINCEKYKKIISDIVDEKI